MKGKGKGKEKGYRSREALVRAEESRALSAFVSIQDMEGQMLHIQGNLKLFFFLDLEVGRMGGIRSLETAKVSHVDRVEHHLDRAMYHMAFLRRSLKSLHENRLEAKEQEGFAFSSSALGSSGVCPASPPETAG